MRMYAKPICGMQLCLLRSNKDLNVNDASNLCGISRRLIWMIEKGSAVSVHTAIKIATGYEINLNDYFILTEKKE